MAPLSPLSLRVWGKCHVGQDALLLLECMLMPRLVNPGPQRKKELLVFYFFPELMRKTLLELMAMFLSGQCYHYISSVRFVFLPQIYEFINKGDQQEAGQWRRWGVFYL